MVLSSELGAMHAFLQEKAVELDMSDQTCLANSPE
jgi:hypothetical protein